MLRFRDRGEAGKLLAQELRGLAAEEPLVLALPRGGVPVGLEVARVLRAPLDVWVVRKIGAPSYPELGVGAVAEDGFIYLNRDILHNVGLREDELEAAIASKRREVEERVELFRGGRSRPEVRARSVVVVDDGIATGGTVRAVLLSLRAHEPKRLVLAVPVAAASTAEMLEPEVDRLVCLRRPRDLYAIGLWYDDFSQVPDAQVLRLLAQARAEAAAGWPATDAQRG